MRISDWSSDVCSSDLLEGHRNLRGANVGRAAGLKPLLQDKRASGVALQRQKAGDACACRLRGYPAAARGARQRKDPRLPQYRRWCLVTSREVRRAWRFTAAAALRLRSRGGFSWYSRLRVSDCTVGFLMVLLKGRRGNAQGLVSRVLQT